MNGLFAIRREVSRQTQVGLAVASWSLLLFVWFGLTHWAKLPPFALPRPERCWWRSASSGPSTT